MDAPDRRRDTTGTETAVEEGTEPRPTAMEGHRYGPLLPTCHDDDDDDDEYIPRPQVIHIKFVYEGHWFKVTVTQAAKKRLMLSSHPYASVMTTTAQTARTMTTGNSTCHMFAECHT